MKHSLYSLAAVALTLSTSVIASPTPQLLVPIIDDSVTCLAVNVIAELIIGDPLAIAYCAVSNHLQMFNAKSNHVEITNVEYNRP